MNTKSEKLALSYGSSNAFDLTVDNKVKNLLAFE